MISLIRNEKFEDAENPCLKKCYVKTLAFFKKLEFLTRRGFLLLKVEKKKCKFKKKCKIL